MKTVLTGITRNYSNEDGELEVMENLRHDGASLRPIGDVESINVDLEAGERVVFMHQHQGREFLIIYKENALFLYGEIIGNDVTKIETHIIDCSEPIRIVQLGIYLYVHTEDKDYTLRMDYHMDINEIAYQNIDFSLLDISLYAREEQKYLVREYYSTESGLGNETIEARADAMRYVSTNIGTLLQILNKLKTEDNYLYDSSVVRAAIRLRSGDYIYHTAPVLLHPIGNEAVMFYDEPFGGTEKDDDTDKYYYPKFNGNVKVNAYRIKITIPRMRNIRDFADEIEGVDLFFATIPNILTDSTKPYIYHTGIGSIKVNDKIISGVKCYPFESGDLKERIKGLSSADFKYIKSYSINELENGVTEVLDLKDFFSGKVELRDFSDDEFSRNILSGQPFVYNNMLHLSAVKSKWFKGYNPFYFVDAKVEIEDDNTGGGDVGGSTPVLPPVTPPGNAYVCSVCGYTYYDSIEDIPFEEQNEYDYKCPICGVGKDKFESSSGNDFRSYSLQRAGFPIVKNLQGVSFSFTNNAVQVNSVAPTMKGQEFGYMISYPSKGMKTLRIKAIELDTGRMVYLYYWEDRLLEDMDFLNLSFLLGNVAESSYQAEDKTKNKYKCTNQKLYKIRLTQDYRYEDNVKDEGFLNIRVEDIEITDNKIKVSDVLNPLVFPVSQTYQVGQGEIKDLSVASTALSQGQFGQFPLYVFCSDGVYAMNVGTGVAYTNSSPVSRDVITGDLISIDKAVAFISDRGLKILQGDSVVDVSLQMQSNAYEQLQGEKFEDFIKEAKLAYNYFFGEIYLLREDKEFAFVYELKNQTWATRKIDFKGKLEVYPDLYIQSKEGVYKLSRENYPEGRQKVKLKTRPMKWGDGFKKVARMIIRGLVIGNWDIKILASNDGVNFHEIRRASISTNTPKRDIPFGRISGSFKYYVLEIEADMDEKSYIEYLETELQNSIFNNKLR